LIAGVADTHTALWYLFGDGRLSVVAKAFIDESAEVGHQIAVSSISLAELVYLVEKGRLSDSAYAGLAGALADPDHVFMEASFTATIVQSMKQVPRADVPDMPDRMIAATALYLNVPIISRDGRIRASPLMTIW